MYITFISLFIIKDNNKENKNENTKNKIMQIRIISKRQFSFVVFLNKNLSRNFICINISISITIIPNTRCHFVDRFKFSFFIISLYSYDDKCENR